MNCRGGHSYTQETPHELIEKDALTEAERQALLDEYVSRGRALRLEGDRGIIDSHARRALNLGQFLTPARVVRVLYQALGLMDHPAWCGTWSLPKRGSILDFAGCGIGRMFQFAPQGWTLHGADVDPVALRAARLIFPEAELIQASLLDFRGKCESRFSAALLNPPFSVTLSDPRPLDLKCAQWGVWGQGTSVESHVAALELALKLAGSVGAILPTSALSGDSLKSLNRFLDRWHGIRLQIDLPRDAFKEEGTEWGCSVVILGGDSMPSQHHSCHDWEDVEAALKAWISENKKGQESRRWGACVLDALRHVEGRERSCLASARIEPPKVKQRKPLTIQEGVPTVRLALAGLAHKILMLPNGPIAALAIDEARLWSGWKTSDGFEPQSGLDWSCDLVRNSGRALESIGAVQAAFERLGGLQVMVDDQLINHARKADRRAWAERTDFAQAIRKGDRWTVRPGGEEDPNNPAASILRSRRAVFGPRADGITTGVRVKGWDRAQRRHVERAWPAFPMYDFARADVVRCLGKRAVIYSALQGLGKTRFSIGAVIASGMNRAVWVLETRLVNEFKRELKKLGLLDWFHLIDKAEDLKALKTFNVITYSRLWRPVNPQAVERRHWGPGTSFAAALGKRRPFVILDEAHKIKAATSKQGIAARLLCTKARRVVLMTGTAIQSYPRNIVGLVNAAYGDGSSTNPYGYRRPVEGGYSVEFGRNRRTRNPLIKGVTKFVDEFVDVIWFTPAFESTASAGMKSREIPALKDVPLWESFIRSKIIRRVTSEPEVRASGVSIPAAKREFVGVQPTPEHYAHYKVVLDEFARIWKDRLGREGSGGRSENGAAYILPELDALRFASTVPVAEHRWAKAEPMLRYTSGKPTALMMEAMRRIWAWVEAGERVLVGAEKPDALRWLADLLADLPSHIPDAEPVFAVLAHDPDIKRRNEAIDRVRDEGQSQVLLLSVGMGMEGLNLPEFSKLLTLDLGWTPGHLDQYAHRILRPDQAGDPEIIHLFHEGLIDAYMRQLTEAKTDAIAQAIDGQETEFDYTEWKDYRTFALEMLELEGYKFATELLEKQRRGSAA